MPANDTPLITLELGRGSFRIVTPEAVYEINSRPPEPAPEIPKPAAVREMFQNVNQDFFREISEELYSAVGRLTRRLSVSIEDLPHDLSNQDWSQSGEKLENAKFQLEEVVKITEKASMEIMDLADLIHDDLGRLQSELTALNDLEFMTRPLAALSPDGRPSELQSPTTQEEEDPDGNPAETPPAEAAGSTRQELQAKVGDLIDYAQTLARIQLPGPPVTAEPQAELAGESLEAMAREEPAGLSQEEIIHFDLDAVFQTLYELCTNEAVKDHLKEMWNDQVQAFDKAAVEHALFELADSVDVEDNFYNFPIPAVLKSLYAATPSEKYKTILKKMNQTAASIFLDSVLPIEGAREIVEVLTPETDDLTAEDLMPEPDATKLEPAALELAAGEITPYEEGGLNAQQMAELMTRLESLAGAIETFSPSMAVNGDYTQVRAQDREAVVNSVTASNDLIQKAMGHLTHILEALSFQDLSGQRIERIVALITDVQLQLLSLLVSVGSKIKLYQASPNLAANTEEAEKIARAEADKMMEKVNSSTELKGPGAESRLDQGAVNDLLAQLGF